MPEQTILLVEDDPDTVRIVTSYLSKNNFKVTVARDGLSALNQTIESPADLILLDWNLPGLDGLEFLKRLRKTRSVPVIMITARTEEIDRVIGLEFGADDYLTKPFSVRELVARVRAVLRRTNQQPEATPVRLGDLHIDPIKREATYKQKELDLTTLEFNLLMAFVTQAGRVFTRDELLRQVWGQAFLGTDRVVDVHVSNLRKKLESAGANHVFETVRGVGYKMLEA